MLILEKLFYYGGSAMLTPLVEEFLTALKAQDYQHLSQLCAQQPGALANATDEKRRPVLVRIAETGDIRAAKTYLENCGPAMEKTGPINAQTYSLALDAASGNSEMENLLLRSWPGERARG